MDESQFHEVADELLEELMGAVEAADTTGEVEVDILGGVLNISLPDGGEYVINKHAPSSQIWVSSPISGAHHFDYDPHENDWVSTEGETFRDVITKELSRRANLDLEF